MKAHLALVILTASGWSCAEERLGPVAWPEVFTWEPTEPDILEDAGPVCGFALELQKREWRFYLGRGGTFGLRKCSASDVVREHLRETKAKIALLSGKAVAPQRTCVHLCNATVRLPVRPWIFLGAIALALLLTSIGVAALLVLKFREA